MASTSDAPPGAPYNLNEDPKQWKRGQVIEFLTSKQEEYDLDTADIETFRQQKVAGRDFLELVKNDLREPPYNFADGTARRIKHLINTLKLQAPPSEFLRQQHPSATRKRRWEELNPVLNAVLNKKAKINENTEKKTGSVAYSNVTWQDVEAIFEPLIQDVTIESAEVPDTILQNLLSYISVVTAGLGNAITGNEQKRLLLIAPILFYLLQIFRDDGVTDMKLLIEQSIPGKNINVNGKFEFVIQRGRKKVCVVEAKRDDMDQGVTQDLLGCEAVSDIENASCVYGIVTNYRDWIFFRSLDDKIERDSTTLSTTGPGGNLPSEEGLKRIMGKIYRLLSE